MDELSSHELKSNYAWIWWCSITSTAFLAIFLSYYLFAVRNPLRDNDATKKKKHVLPPFIPVGFFYILRNYSEQGPLLWRDLVEQYGHPVCCIKMLPKWLAFLLNRPSIIVLITDPHMARRYLQSPKCLKPVWLYKSQTVLLSKPGFSTSEGFRAMHVKKSLALAFQSKNTKYMLDIVMMHVRLWIKSRFLEGEGKDIDVGHELSRVMMKGMVEAMFRYRMSDGEIETFILLHQKAWKFRKTSFAMVFRSAAPGYNDARTAGKQIRKLVTRFIEKYRSRPLNVCNPTVIDYLMKDTNYCSDDDRINDFVTITGASYDTTAYTIVWAMIDLCHHPFEQDKLRKALHFAEPHERSNIPELRNTIRESSRLHPVGGTGSFRTMAHDFFFEDFVVPKGQLVMASLFNLQRNKQVFENPLTFIPSRWNSMKEESKSSSIPFSLGRRSCPGIALAQAVVRETISQLFEANVEYSISCEGEISYQFTFHTVGTRFNSKRI